MNYFIQLFVGKIIRAKFLLLLCLFAQITLLMSYVHATTDFVPMEIPQGEIWGDLDGELFMVGNHGNILHYDGENYSYMSSGTQHNLTDIWGSNNNDVYAVGYQVDGYTVLGSIVLHYDGTQWSKIFSNNNTLHDIWGSSQKDVFVVGNFGTIIHYDGNTWTEMSSGTTNGLLSVWGSSSNDVFAVGGGGTILHFNGTEWTVMSSGITQQLSAIWGSSSSDVYAVGPNGIRLHFDGNKWSKTTYSIPYFFYDIWGSGPSDIYVAGRYGEFSDSVVYHFNGTSWSAKYNLRNIYDIWGRNSAEIYALADGKIYKKDGNSWVQVLSPPGSGTFSDMWGVGNEIFAVRYDGFYRYDGNIWSHTDLETDSITLSGVWGDSNNNIYAVGGTGSVYHFDGNGWSKMVSTTSQSLTGVWGANNGEVFAVGQNGTILHYDGISWSAMPSGTTISLTKIWGSSENDVFAVGSSGTILHYNGITWSKMTSGSAVSLTSVFGINNNNVFAVGGNGTILHYDGTSWSKVESPTIDLLNDIWIDSNNNVYIAGPDYDNDGFYIYKYNGSVWSPMSSPYGLAHSVWGNANHEFFVSTDRGLFYQPSPCAISSPSQTGAGNIIPSTLQIVSYNGNGKYVLTPLESYHVANISGSCPQGTLSDNLDGSYTYLTGSILSDCTIVVNFTQTFTLSYSSGANGSIVGESLQEVYPGRDGSAVEAVPNEGYKFVNWSDGITDNPRIDTNVANEIQVTANFVKLSKIFPSVSGSGSITPFSSQEVPYNSAAGFILTPDPHNSLSNVSGTCPSGTTVDNGDGSFTYTTGKITEDCTLIANFLIDTYTLQYSTSIEGYLQGNTNQIVSYGSSGTEVLAIPFEHYNFLKWSDGSSENPRIDSNIIQNISVNALYVGDVHNVVFKKIHNDTVVDSITNSVEYGHITSFNITPDVGYYLSDVATTCNGGTVSGNTYTTYAIGSDCTVTARYTNKYSVNVSVINNGGSITPSATQIVTFGQNVQYLFAPDTGFHVNEINSTCGVGTLVNNIYRTPEITKDCDIAVGFSNIYSVTPSIGSGTGTITPSTVQQVEFNKTTQFTITPDPGYHIENVTGSCLGSLAGNIYTTNRISDNCTVIVNFVQSIFSINTISFENEGFIPIKYTGFGDDFSPPLTWEYPPEGTKSYVLVMSDLDAKDPYWGDEWKHWIVYNIPVSQKGLPENSGAKNSVNLPAGAKHGATSWWEAGILPGNYYQGPKPPTDTGAHRYVIRLFALDVPEINPFDDTGMGCSYYEVAQSMVGHVLGFADLKGKYEESFPWNLFMPAIITPHNKQK